MPRSTRHTATRLALALAGAGLAVAGGVLLLRAAWIALSLPLGAMWASVVLGSVLLLVGALVFAVATHRTPRREPTDDDLIVRLTTAFFEGLAAGRSRRDR